MPKKYVMKSDKAMPGTTPPPLPDELTNQSLCPFGQYKGTPLEHVPPQYLAWCWGKFIHKQYNSPMFRYIVKHIEELEQSDGDAIWEPDPRRSRPKQK